MQYVCTAVRGVEDVTTIVHVKGEVIMVTEWYELISIFEGQMG